MLGQWYLPMLRKDLSKDEGEEKEETDEAEVDEEQMACDVCGESTRPGWDDYATLLECLQTGAAQKSASIPVQSEYTAAGQVCTESLYMCSKKNCRWLSRSKAEQNRHSACHHCPVPLKATRAKIMATAAAKTPDRVAAPMAEVKGFLEKAKVVPSAKPAAAKGKAVSKAVGKAKAVAKASDAAPEPPKKKAKVALAASGADAADDADLLAALTADAIKKISKRRLTDGIKESCVVFVDAAKASCWIKEESLPEQWRLQQDPDLTEMNTLLEEPGGGDIKFDWESQTYEATHKDQVKVFIVSKYSRIKDNLFNLLHVRQIHGSPI